MKITPPTRYRKRPFAILYPGQRMLGVDSEMGRQVFTGRRNVERALFSLSDHVLFVQSGLEGLKHTTGALSWKMTAWKGRQTGMVHLPSGARVSSLRQTIIESETPYDDLARVMNWLEDYGVTPGSISGMAWNLFRSSLSGEVTISCDADLGRASFYGGRQQITTPKRYQGMMAADITAAYPFAMASRDYALSLREVSKTTLINPEEPGIAIARVAIPSSLPYGPLPIRIDSDTIQFPYGTVQGTWTWCELDAAKELGCDVQVEQCFAPRRRADLFFSWWQMGMTGRKLSGDSRNLAKAILNSTWGQFAMNGDDRSEVSWADDAGEMMIESKLDSRNLPHQWTAHIAAETTARVRRRMLLEGLYGPTKPPVHVDTDGIIISATSPMPLDTGDEVGQWRKKTNIAELDLRAPQLYRYDCGISCGIEHSKWHYVASGMNQLVAEHYFENHNYLKTTVAFFGDPDRVLPREYSGDLDAIERWSREARSLTA